MPQPPDQSSGNQLETSLFSLAYPLVEDKLKNILPYLVGFEIQDKSENNSKAMGVFIFKTPSKQVLVVPILFINGKVKPPQLLYVKNVNQFFPLNEDWAELFIQQDVGRLGKPSDLSRADVMNDTPAVDLRNMIVPPRTGKYTYASIAEPSEDFSVLNYVKQASNKVKSLFRKMLSNEKYAAAILQHYSIEKIAAATVPESERPGKKYREGNGVRILDTGENFATDGLDEDQKEQLATDGMLVIDPRPESEKSRFVRGSIQNCVQFTNPDETGFYPYWTRGGTIRYGLVICKPMQLGLPFATCDTLIINLDNAHTYVCDSKHVFVKNKILLGSYDDVHKKMVEPANVEPSYKNYILINKAMKATVPFRVRANFKDDVGLRRLDVELYRSWDRPPVDAFGRKAEGPGNRQGSIRDIPQSGNIQPQNKPERMMLVMTKMVGDKMTHRGDTVYVPAGFRLLEVDLDKPSEFEFGMGSTSGPGSPKKESSAYKEWLEGLPAKTDTIYGALMSRDIFPMTVRSNGSEYFYNIQDVRKDKNSNEYVKKRFSTGGAMKAAMVTQLGMDWKEASAIVDSMDKTANTKIEGFLKIAITGETPNLPVDEAPYSDEYGTPTTMGVPYESQIPPDNVDYPDPLTLNQGVKPQSAGHDGLEHDIDQAVELSNSGQKNLFDLKSIATLAKYVNPESKIEEYLPQFLTSLDYMGRLVFMAEWDADKFIDMFGRDDMPQFMDMLKNVFKHFGDIIMFLKRKNPEMSLNMSETDQLSA